NLARVAAMERKVDQWILGEKSAKQPGEHVLRDSRGNSKREFTGNFAVLATQLSFRFGSHRREFVRVRQQNSALSSQRNAPTLAVEQPHAEITFECFDLQSYSRLSEEQLLRGFVKIYVLRDGAKHLQAKVFQLRHEQIIHRNNDRR